jgi:hypothetical protein
MGFLGPPSYSPAQTVGSADWNTYVRDNLRAMASNTLLYLGSSITIGAGLTAQANLSAELYDSPDGMGDPTTNHRITIKQAGTYRVYFEVGGATGATTITWFAKKNGASTFMSKTVGPGSECYCDFAGAFSVADYLELWVTNGSTAVTALNQVSRRPATVMAVLGVEWTAP